MRYAYILLPPTVLIQIKDEYNDEYEIKNINSVEQYNFLFVNFGMTADKIVFQNKLKNQIHL